MILFPHFDQNIEPFKMQMRSEVLKWAGKYVHTHTQVYMDNYTEEVT